MSKNNLSEQGDELTLEHLIKFDPAGIFWIDSRLSNLLGRRKEPDQTRRGSVDEAFEIVELRRGRNWGRHRR